MCGFWLVLLANGAASMPGYRPTLELLRGHASVKACLDQLADPELA
jgi:hypothetical protein